MGNVIREVPLRKRSTPYDFTVIMKRGPREKQLYSGTSHKYAQASYWQGITVGCFLGLSGSVHITVTLAKEPYGGFATEIASGKVTESIHIPSGKCVEWTKGSWSGQHLAEKLVATIPGMPGPIPFQT